MLGIDTGESIISIEIFEKLSFHYKSPKSQIHSSKTPIHSFIIPTIFGVQSNCNSFYNLWPLCSIEIISWSFLFLFKITERIEECIRWGHLGGSWAPRSTKETKMQVPLNSLLRMSAYARFVPFPSLHITLL